ncbi:endopeptidase La [Congregibacter litoralis]|uniref:Lon protease n=1 Tax=Congregibacter litoralis KT71 TaxID=314285 RepID=A4ACZ9_9GAMM|nr:endopeptidase La [Congregibacter litoralis]EAQ96052.1 putative serine peptidase [Congregibacter litoralis KT71]
MQDEKTDEQESPGLDLSAEIVNDEAVLKSSTPAVADDVLPESLYLIPVPQRPFFPGQVQPVGMDLEEWGGTIKEVMESSNGVVGLAYVDPGQLSGSEPEPKHFPEIGCVVRLHRPPMVAENPGQFLAQGVRRFRIVRWLNNKPPYRVQVEYPRSQGDRESDDVKAYAMAVLQAVKELLPLNPLYSEELRHYIANFNPNQPSLLADFSAALTTAKGEQLQEILETLPLQSRMQKVLTLLGKEREVAELRGKITEQVNEKVSDQQREFFLREQMKVIQKELGISKDDRTSDAERFEERLEALVLPDAVRERIDDELQKLSVLEPGSPEYGVTRNYLDWATQVPWGLTSEDNLDLKHAATVLDADHDGLDDVKDRILEFLAVGSFKGEIAGSILLLVGPPGVGKTSIGRSVASALGREFYRFSLGGMRDEAEIKGHRRTYIGAMPGKFVQALKEVKVANPVIMLDEIDKIGASFRGDPASALLEVLDPEQNSEFLDHYLDLRVDLSKVLFICTANQLDTIPGPLLDRMETLRLSGYVAEEKLAIARNHLWPKQLERHGLENDQLKINDPALKYVIESYCREAGVRNLEKQLSRIMRKAIVDFVKDRGKGRRQSAKTPKSGAERRRIGKRDIEDLLGKPLFQREKPQRGIGVATGLAWTAMGGATLPVESSRVHTLNRGFKLTGRLGDVMRESADIAYSFIVSHLKDYRCDPDFFDTSMVHLHVPEGATPKDGPSAGITIATALVSLARKERIRRPLAMTGELTLTGQVLPVGGIREKVIAARRAKIMELILPHANRRDFEELPDYLREGINVHFARTFRDVFETVFEDHRRDKPLH